MISINVFNADAILTGMWDILFFLREYYVHSNPTNDSKNSAM